VTRLIIFFLVVFIASCSNRSSIPGDILPSDSMAGIMKDVIMAQEYSSLYISRDSLKKDKRKANQDLLEAIFKIHHTTRDEFKKSLDFYESRPDLNKNLFDSLAADANRHKPEMFTPTPVTNPAHTPGNIVNPAHVPGKPVKPLHSRLKTIRPLPAPAK
jgi:hypothetical protein